MTAKNRHIAVLIDDQDRFSFFWRLGLKVNKGRDLRAKSWAEAYDLIARSNEAEPIEELHFWGHGQAGAPLLAGRPVNLRRLHTVLGGRDSHLQAVWWRNCDVHKGKKGRDFALEVVTTLSAASVGHTQVISKPLFWRHKDITAYTTGHYHRDIDPRWKDSGNPSCSTFTMEIPWTKALAWARS